MLHTNAAVVSSFQLKSKTFQHLQEVSPWIDTSDRLECLRLIYTYKAFIDISLRPGKSRIKASAGPGAVPNAGPLQTYNQLTG